MTHVQITEKPLTVLHCTCERSQLISEETSSAVDRTIRSLGAAAVTVTDLCGLAGRRDERLTRICRNGRLLLVACHARAATWLLQSAGIDASAFEFVDQRDVSVAAVIAALEERIPASHAGSVAVLAGDDDWMPWFPVIDRDRCTDCGQCASFCLFGVYKTAANGRVEVTNPQACKVNCPACARVCPEAAVIFPKLSEEPFNGAEVTAENLQRGGSCVDLGRLADGDVRELFARRREMAAGRRLLRRQALEQAEAERCDCSCSCEPAPACGGGLSVLPKAGKGAM